MEIIKADIMGMCDGVKAAIGIADKITIPHDVTVYGELAHNDDITEHLKRKGFYFIKELSEPIFCTTGNLLIPAHGISLKRKAIVESYGLNLIDATCPLVKKLHETAMLLKRAGRYIVIIGKKNHVEVIGVAEDLVKNRYSVVEKIEDVRFYDEKYIGIVCQTTSDAESVENIVERIRDKNRGSIIKFVDTICPATKKRQDALKRLCKVCDIVIIVGGKKSNNTNKLNRICEKNNTKSYIVSGSDDVDLNWFIGVKRAGITAGASTPNHITIDVERKIKKVNLYLKNMQFNKNRKFLKLNRMNLKFVSASVRNYFVQIIKR